MKKAKPSPHYDKVLKEAESVTHKIIQENVPELCKALRDEYHLTDWTKEKYFDYLERDGITYEIAREFTQEELLQYAKEEIESRNNYVKVKIMVDMQGVLFNDKVYTKHGYRLLPKESKKIFSMEHAKEGIKKGSIPTERWNRVTESWEIMTTGSFDRKKEIQEKGIFKGYTYSKPKDMSEMAKFVESVIDQEIASWEN